MLEVLKSRSKTGKPCDGSPMRASKTPFVTVNVVDDGADAGHSRVPPAVSLLFQIENLKS